MDKNKEFILKPDSTQENADWIKKVKTENGQIFAGTPAEIMAKLREAAYNPGVLPEEARHNLHAYIDHLQESIGRIYGAEIDTSGPSLEARANKTIQELKRIGFLAEKE